MTVDVWCYVQVGASGLKADHEALMSMQGDIEDREERFRGKTNKLTQIRNQVSTMEGDVKNFEKKEKIERTIALLKTREAWANVRTPQFNTA